jgi:cytochrome c oxidase subunit 2
MKKLVACAAVVLAVGLLLRAQETPKPPETPVHEIKISAKKYEYSPSEIRVKQGEHVRLLITATDRKHGFEIKDLGIKTDLLKGKETVVEFTAEKAGTYQIKCSSFCGLGHGGMRAKLVVEPANAAPPSN